MSRRVKLCAIAQNEGPYLADWVFHHLHLGFDGVEVWVNGTQDTSAEILAAIGTTHPHVHFRLADDVLEESRAKGKYFQYRAYTKMARKALREGYTHAAFLDLDEYWLPRSFAGSIHDFLPEGDDVNVVSFPWGLDLPDPERPAFSHPLTAQATVQLDRHVKSVVTLDDRIRQLRPHTARTTSGARRLVRDPFPMADEVEQQWGSFLPAEHFATLRDRLPEAFVLHAVNRSELEYVASLKKAHRMSEEDSPYRDNRTGYRPAGGPVLPLDLPPAALADYHAARQRFREEAGLDPLVEASETSARHRASDVLAAVGADPALMERMRGALHRVSAPELERRHPGWDYHLQWWVDEVAVGDDGASVSGWAFTDRPGNGIEFAFRDPADVLRPAGAAAWSPRPDVVHVHPVAPLDCGFRVDLPPGLPLEAGTTLLARPAGSSVWSRVALTMPRARSGSSRPTRGTASR